MPAFAAIYLLTLLMLLSELDRQYYQVAKESLIKYNFAELFPHDTVRLQELSREILSQHRSDGPSDAGILQEWRNVARTMLAGEGCVFRIRIVPKDEPELVVEEDAAKFARLNSLSNTLFYRNFQNVVSYEIAGVAGEPWTGLLSFHYTTPQDYPPVVAMTNRFRLWALLIVVVITAGYGLVLRRLILPMKHVISRIDAAAGGAPRLMESPASMLEKAYNSLARDAILLRVAQSLRDAIAAEPELDRSALLDRIPDTILELMDYRDVRLLELAPIDGGGYTVTRCTGTTAGHDRAALEGKCTELAARPELIATLGEEGGAMAAVEDGCVLCDISLVEDHPRRTCLALFPKGRGTADSVTRAWQRETAERLAAQLLETVAVLDVNRRHVRDARSRANINLARNLGHDLTNIIATSKLDIMTVRKILGAEEGGDDPRRKLLADSVQGLLNNAQFLQEVVNIYRSFSYINRPRFEDVQLDELLNEIIGVFSLSLPPNTKVETRYAEDLPTYSVEPRLLKLATFNVMTNAVDAIKRSGQAEGTVTVLTAADRSTGGVSIIVRDNGPGILNADGVPASQAEIDSIFRYGVSTRSEEGGEGLGLSWVWTIVEEFHGGKVSSRNNPEGGAEFVMRIGSQQ